MFALQYYCTSNVTQRSKSFFPTEKKGGSVELPRTPPGYGPGSCPGFDVVRLMIRDSTFYGVCQTIDRGEGGLDARLLALREPMTPSQQRLGGSLVTKNVPNTLF